MEQTTSTHIVIILVQDIGYLWDFNSGNVLIQWGHQSSNAYAVLPISYTTTYIVSSQCESTTAYNRIALSSLSTFEAWGNLASTWMWISIGY